MRCGTLLLGMLVGVGMGCGQDEQDLVDHTGPVAFADPHLEASVRATLGQPTGELTNEVLSSLTRLEANGREITDLAGIESLRNLQVLRLANNQIRDIAALSATAELCTLDLAHNQVERLEPLSELSRLQDLRLNGNAVKNIGPLFRLKRLTHVELSGNPLDAHSANALVDALRGLKVEVVYDVPPEFADAHLEASVRESLGKPADELTTGALLSLTRLDASGRGIGNLAGIEQLKNLEVLRLADNQIQDIAALSAMAQLCTLDLAHNQVERLEPLIELSRLRYLRLNGNAVRDISALSRLKGLTHVDLSGNPLDVNSSNALVEALRGMEIAVVLDVPPAPEGNGTDRSGVLVGFHIVYSSGIKKSDLWLMPADSTRRILLSEEPYGVYDLFWSPDSKKIGFILAKGTVFTMEADGTLKSMLVAGSPGGFQFITGPSWSPDGQRILFEADRAGHTDVFTMNTDGTDVRNLTNDPSDDSGPRWSPDGQRILFTRKPGSGHSEIFVASADGSNSGDLTNDPATDFQGVWSPDGTRVAFSSDRAGSWDIWVMDADGRRVLRLTDDLGGEFSPVWSPDGARITFLQYWDPSSSDSDVLVMQANGGAQRKLTDYPSSHGNLQWSPDGSKVLFLSGHDGKRDIHMADADGSSLVYVTQDTVDVACFAVAPR